MMNLDRSFMFSFIEEDNIQRAFFRVRPLLTVEGLVQAEAEKLWPNEGCLRIVPDRNEQHTFKTRMRTLGSYCVVDLTNQPVDAAKIRTNKNYRPDHGEVNQYILYSDTVHPVPEHTFYQLLDGTAADYAALADKAVTPLFYIRENDTLYGPVQKASPAQPETAKAAEGVLFEVPCPDGVARLIFCMNDAPAAEAPAEESKPEASAKPAAPAAEEALPIGQNLNILDQSKDHEETLKALDQPVSRSANLLRRTEAPAKPAVPAPAVQPVGELNGTPLVKTPLRTSQQQPKNHVQEVISSQWTVSKYEPPTSSLPAGTVMRSVKNPVEAACAHLKEAWHATDARAQLTDFILSLDGIRTQLEPRLCEGQNVTVMQRLLRDRLQDLEAERLTALCELDRARRDLDTYKNDLIQQIGARLRRETADLESARSAAETQVAALKEELNALTLQRDALLARIDALQADTLPATVAKLVGEMHMAAPVGGVPLRISPVSGQTASVDEMIGRLTRACEASGFAITRNDAVSALVLLALYPRVGLVSSTPAPLATLMKNIMSAFGWTESFGHQYAAEQKPVIGMKPVDSTPALLLTSLPNYAPLSAAHKLLLARSNANLTHNAAYDACQWPIISLPALPYVPLVEDAAATPVSEASLQALTAVNAASDQEINKALEPILKHATPLAGASRKDMHRYISVCAGMMDGGLPVAVDHAIMLWVLPGVDRASRNFAALKTALDEYPLSLSRL